MNDAAIDLFDRARIDYTEGRFGLARQLVQQYRRAVRYDCFQCLDARAGNLPRLSVIIVFHVPRLDVLNTVDELLRQANARPQDEVEIVVVSNGCVDESVCESLTKRKCLLVMAPHNFLPSEGRNIGAHFSRGSFLVFVDADGLPQPGYIIEIFSGFECGAIALRGQIQVGKDEPAPPHYDLGSTPKDVRLNLEGNMAIKRSVFRAVGGFDPLMFGHEGHELTDRIQRLLPYGKIKYCPRMLLEHDFARGSNLHAKRQRQWVGNQYRKWLSERAMSFSI
jgi:glycosyltransferase involved in cell wall biosynthesis